MPPLYAQDPLAAVQRGLDWRWLDVPYAIAGGATEPWVVALLALALYAWLEHEVRHVLAAFLPLVLAMAVAGGLALAARALGAAPRPVGGAAAEAGTILRSSLSGANVAVAATFAAYSLLAYGRRAWVSLVVALVAAASRAAGGAGGVDLAGGGVMGLVAGASSYAAAIRLLPGGHLARLRARRGGQRVGARPGA